MKRLVICCDGTWNRADNPTVSNVEKLARTIQLDPARAAGVQQMVLYLPGVGTAGYRADKILGGAFGLGLTNNVLNACLLYTSPSPRDISGSRMPSSA